METEKIKAAIREQLGDCQNEKLLTLVLEMISRDNLRVKADLTLEQAYGIE